MGNKKKKWMIGLAVFLLVMLALTIISRSVYAYYLPLVETTTVQEKYIEHGFEEEGLVVAGNEIPVNSCQDGDKIAFRKTVRMYDTNREFYALYQRNAATNKFSIVKMFHP